MDASTTPQGPEFNNVMCNLLFKTKTSNFSPTLGRKNTVIKYAKLPDYDFESKIEWPQPDSYVLPAKLRKIIALEDEALTCSLNSETAAPMKITKHTTRKTVTITEDNDSQRITTREAKRSSSAKYSHRASGSDQDKLSPLRSSAKSPSKSNKKLERACTKSATWNNKDVPKSNRSRIVNNNNNQCNQEVKSRITQSKEKQNQLNKNQNGSSKVCVSKKVAPSNLNEQGICHVNRKMNETVFRSDMTSKKSYYRPKSTNLPSKPSIINEIVKNDKAAVAIYVPKETVSSKKLSKNIRFQSKNQVAKIEKIECGTDTGNGVFTKEENVQTYPEPNKVNRVTETQTLELEITQSEIKQLNEEISDLKDMLYDCLNTPNITLTKDRKFGAKKSVVASADELCIPTIESPPFKNIPNENESNEGGDNHPPQESSLIENEDPKTSQSEINPKSSSSFIISRRTLTYTTKQEINFDVVDNHAKTSHSYSNITPKIVDYPLNVMTVFRTDDITRLRELPKNEDTQTKKEEVINIGCMTHEKLNKSINCYSPGHSSKLIKPSEIISTIRVNSGFLQNDYICEQFERELNFIDSFFESLQYLENCSLADKCLSDGNAENWVNNSGLDNPEYRSLFSNLENGSPTDTETMASKSLCLLNLLIRDEQRRAKNLLFVLKMREDALKDFTKSQILWLENKKKLDNTDTSTLKKKQRGALLKLQHECGEMQRMRKALVALSEKRKGALMKTKNNIELKLKNNVTVDQILLGKKKLKRNTSTDRNVAPLKCFDLSSSGCDEVTPPRTKSDSQMLLVEKTTIPINIAEKCVQTGDSLLGSCLVDSATDTAAENFVTVDGTYLNILFNNISLPQIFSAGKQYEVNEEALKNIVNTNTQIKGSSESDAIDKLMDHIKSKEQDSVTSSPSTARSLVEELDQYYKDLAEEGKLPLLELDENVSNLGPEDHFVDADDTEICRRLSQISLAPDLYSTSTSVEKEEENIASSQVEGQDGVELSGDESLGSGSALTGPLPVPAGASATVDTPRPDAAVPLFMEASSASISSNTSQESQSSDLSPVSSMTSPALNEAEELRRQQLAIEREIKALEQQQCQLLAVREIPDKPPPPYTPPADPRKPKASRTFQIDNSIEEKVHKRLCNNIAVVIEPNDVFDVFLQDFCDETINRYKIEHNEKPWDASSLLPPKTPMDAEKLAAKATAEIKEILSGRNATVVSGVGARRSDHIDDILYSEWRRCESEWTALHSDEAAVKNQIFEDIFQRVLTETIDEYKETVHRITHMKDDES